MYHPIPGDPGMKKQSSLERKMLSYFGLIAAASLLITVEFVYAIQAATPGPEALGLASADSSTAIATVVNSLHSLRGKALLMCVVQAVVTLIVLIMFMRRITGPLQHMVETSRLISEGDLSQTVRIRTPDEIGLLGETINGLASNIQELVTLGLSTKQSLQESLEDLRTKVGEPTEAAPEVDEIERKLEMFGDLMSDFKLFPAPPAAPEAGGTT
jgi:methyl-accepting chemotaxis protein